MDAKYKQYYDRVATYIPAERLYTDDLHCLAWGTDAGFYRRLPQIVVRSKDEDEVSRLLKDASDMHLPVTFRAAGKGGRGRTSPTRYSSWRERIGKTMKCRPMPRASSCSPASWDSA